MKCVIATPSRTLFALPFWMAEWKGFFAEEGIDVRLEIGGSGDRIKAGLRSGQFLMSIDPPDSVLVDASNGGSLRILAGNACKPPLFVIAQPEIQTLTQLRGRTFGVLSLREGSSKFIPLIAAAAGLQPGDCRIVEVGGAPARAKLLYERKIDVGLQPMPLSYEAEAKGYNNLGWTGVYEPHYQFTTVNADVSRIGRDPALAVSVLRALVRGQRWALGNPDEAAPALAERLETEIGHATASLRQASVLGILDDDLSVSELGLARIAANLRDEGLVSQDAGTRMNDCTAPEYLSQARDQLQ